MTILVLARNMTIPHYHLTIATELYKPIQDVLAHKRYRNIKDILQYKNLTPSDLVQPHIIFKYPYLQTRIRQP